MGRIGLDPVIIRAVNVSDFRRNIRLLAKEAELRHEIGLRTRVGIEAVNTGEAWIRSLSQVYRQVLQAPQVVAISTLEEVPCLEDVDTFWELYSEAGCIDPLT